MTTAIPQIVPARRAVVSLLLAVLVLGGLVGRAHGQDDVADLERIGEVHLLEHHVEERRGAGLEALVEYRDIRDVARPWSARMARDGRLSHNPDLAEQVCCAHAIGENVAKVAIGLSLSEAKVRRAAAEAHDRFMDSDRHRANILGKDFSQVGIGATIVHDGTWWWLYLAVDFRAPDGREPSSSGVVGARDIDHVCPDRRPSFRDVDDDNVHARAIACLEHLGIAEGRGNATYGPKETLTRGQIATFLLRTTDAVGIERPAGDACTEGPHAAGMSAMLAWEVFRSGGCDATAPVTRAAMARWTARIVTGPMGIDAPDDAWDYFADDDHLPSEWEAADNAVAEWGIVTGTGPDRFDPDGLLRRDQMATFLARLVALADEVR